MRTGRPVNKDTRYKMTVHTNGGHRYASTKICTVGEDGRKRYAYKHCGTLEDGVRFHPGVNHFYAPLEERKKLIFPDAWDLSEVSELSSTRRPGRISYQEDDVNRQYGAPWFLDRVAKKTGLLEDLKSVFGGNMEMVKDVLTMAYFPFIDNQLSQWQKEVKAPSGRELGSVNITRLTQSITEKHRMDLFRMRDKRVVKDELCAVDSTSISTYSLNLVDIRWGKKKSAFPFARHWKSSCTRSRRICRFTTRNSRAICRTVERLS